MVPGSEIRDPGSGIWDKHPGSATLRESSEKIGLWGPDGGGVGSLRGEARGPSWRGRKKRVGGVEGLKLCVSVMGGWVGSVVTRFYWAEKFSYRTANAPPHHPF
jgi:hypothetical protein